MSSFLGNLCGVFGFNRYLYSSCESAGSSSLTLNRAFSTASLLREQINLVHSLVQWILNRWKIAGYCVMTNACYKFLDFFAWFFVHVTQKHVTFTQNKTLWVKWMSCWSPGPFVFLYICKDFWDCQGANKSVDSARNLNRSSSRSSRGCAVYGCDNDSRYSQRQIKLVMSWGFTLRDPAKFVSLRETSPKNKLQGHLEHAH